MIIYNIQEIKINQKYIFDIIKKKSFERKMYSQIKFVYIK